MMEESRTVIRMEDASFGYEKDRPIVKGMNLAIHAGEAVGLIGANGAGKSTLMKMICGLVGHTGSLKVFDREVEKKELASIRRHLGFVFQDSDSQLFMPTVYDDLAFAPRNYGLGLEEVEKAVDRALERTGIEHLKHRQNYRMSGGEKRMACIATVLAMEPEILLMDEPSIALDPRNRRQLIYILNSLHETKLIASHDLDMILETCERVILLDEGGIRADGPAEEILRDRELLEACHLELPFCLQEVRVYRRP